MCLNKVDQWHQVLQELDALIHHLHCSQDPIEKELQKCPNAFKAGELVERACALLDRGSSQSARRDRSLPPAGAVVPPLA